MTTPTNIDFATEVKSDRLKLLWKITLTFNAIVLLMVLTILTFQKIPTMLWAGAPLVFIIGCLITRYLQEHHTFTAAAWAYTLTSIAAVGVAMSGGGEDVFATAPFAFVLVLFIGGLLLSPASVFIITALAIGVTLLVPWWVTGTFAFLGGYQFYAIVLMIIASGLAAQVTGELYAVTEWAISNYQRERRTNDELFENRQKLELSLLRSEALSDRLQMTNADLENARVTAEAAKNFRGQFLANMSHELRTPLNAIIGFSETMLRFPIMYDGVELPEAYHADMNQIYVSGNQLLTLINDILDLAKVDAGKLEVKLNEVDIEPIIKGTLATANGLLMAKPVRLRTEMTKPLPKVIADENRVRQVLLNFYSNAIKFTDEGEIVLSVKPQEDCLYISVRDTGCGLPEESLSLIFEEFQQADNSRRDPRSGAGLGLAISRQLVTLMNGDIGVESVVGEGSTFYFTLPLAEAAAQEEQTTPAPQDHTLHAVAQQQEIH